MKRLVRWLADFSDQRSQHLVFLCHVWLLAPLLIFWVRDNRIHELLGDDAINRLEPTVGVIIAYLAIRTWLAYKDPHWLKWDYVFPPIDAFVVTLILCISHRGPMSNLALLYFLPIIEAAASLSVPWSATVGLMVVAGTAISANFGLGVQHDITASSLHELWEENSLNIVFRLYFLVVVSSLMTYQALIAAAMKQKLAVAADRNRIAADMHDGVQGHLITIATQLELLQRIADRDPKRAAELAGEARDMARQGADELRFLVQRMRAPALSAGFVPALQQYALNICNRNSLDLKFEIVGENQDLEPEQEGALFRIAQEALNNVIKHACATTVSIRLEFGPPAVLTVHDDGIGCSEIATTGSGILGMEHRMRTLGGQFSITSNLGNGTSIQATI